MYKWVTTQVDSSLTDLYTGSWSPSRVDLCCFKVSVFISVEWGHQMLSCFGFSILLIDNTHVVFMMCLALYQECCIISFMSHNQPMRWASIIFILLIRKVKQDFEQLTQSHIFRKLKSQDSNLGLADCRPCYSSVITENIEKYLTICLLRPRNKGFQNYPITNTRQKTI
jgi:hypothetical protein